MSLLTDSSADPREFLVELLQMAHIQTEIAIRCAYLGDDAMLELSMRRMAAYLRQSHATMHDLRRRRSREVT